MLFSMREHVSVLRLGLDRLSDPHRIRKLTLNKQTLDEPLGFTVVIYKHPILGIAGIFVEGIQRHSLADV